MKLLGLVEWTERDKRGTPIAGVRPLVEMQKSEWREIDARDEFPSQGQVFWPNAPTATKDSLLIFRAEPNPGQKDEFKVVDPKPIYEVIDLRKFGSPADVRTALVEGVPLAGAAATIRALIWCAPDLVVGPVDLKRAATGTTRLSGTNLSRVKVYAGPQVRAVNIDDGQRLVRVDENAPTAYVDWDEDAAVIAHAVEAVVKIAKNAGHDPAQTLKAFKEAARALAAQGVGVGTDATLDQYRLERAVALLEHTDVVATHARALANNLQDHPAVKQALDEARARARTEVEDAARKEMEAKLASERAALKATSESHAQVKTQIEAARGELRGAEAALLEARGRAETAASEAEAAVNARISAAMERPAELLAQVSVLRPLLAASGLYAAPTPASPATPPTNGPAIAWSRGSQMADKAALRRGLTAAARARGVDPSVMLHIHAAVAARLMPVTIGSAGLAALAAYARGACADRALIIHVPPTALQPRDLDSGPEGGLAAAAAAAKDIDGVSIAVLEGANRAPLEATVIPALQLRDAGLAPMSTVAGLRLAATLVAGATTVPVSPMLWTHAVAIYPEADPAPAPKAASADNIAANDVSLAHELLHVGDPPVALVDELLHAWPDCRELRPTALRYGAALARVLDEKAITQTLLHALLLPFVATLMSAEEQGDALAAAGDADGALAGALRRLRRGLC